MRTTIVLMITILAAGCTTVPAPKLAPGMKLAPELGAVPAKPVSGREAFLGRGVLAFDRWNSTVPALLPNDHWLRFSEADIELDRAKLDFSVRSGGEAAA